MNVARAQRTALDIGLVVSAKVLSVGALFTCSLVAARELPVPAYGHFAAALGMVLLLDAVLGSPLDLAVIRFGTLFSGQPSRFQALQILLLRGKILAGFVAVAAGIAFGEPIADAVLAGAPPLLAVTALCTLLAMLVMRGYMVQIQVQQRFQLYSAMDIVQALLRFLGVGLILGGFGVVSATGFLAVFGGAVAVVLLTVAVAMPQPVWSCPLPAPDDRARLARYVLGTSGVVVAGTITGRADLPLVSTVLGAEAAASYGIGVQLAMAGTMLATYVGIVTQPKILALVRAGRMERALALNAAGALALAVLIGLVQATVLDEIVATLFGEVYRASAPLVGVLLWGTCIDFMIMPLLLPYAIQLEGRVALSGELAITGLFLVVSPLALAFGAIGMAWLVTIIRLIKLCFYAVVFGKTQSRHGSVE